MILYALTAFPGGVHRVDASTGETAEIAAFPGEFPDGIVRVPERDELVVTLMGTPDRAPAPGQEPPFTHANGSVQAVPLDGSESRTLVPRGSFTTGKQLTRDPGSGRLYWADREGHGIYRSEADGSGLTALVRTDGAGPSEIEEQCVGVAVDSVAGALYWTQKGPAKGGRGRIFRAGLEIPAGEDAHSRSDIETLWSGLPEPIDLELDPAHGMIYWTDRGAEPDGNTLNRAPLPVSGAQGEVPQILARGFHEAIGLAVDHAHAVAYVADLGGRIRAVDLSTGVVSAVASLGAPVTGITIGVE